MNLDEEQVSIVNSTVSVAAYLGWRRYRAFMSISDARQVAHEWVLRHPNQVAELLEDGVRGQRRLKGRLIAAVTKAGRAEKAHQSGYEPDDEVFYGLPTIELVLPALWDESYRPWRPEDEAGRVKTSGRTYNEWETMVIDVRRAWQEADLTIEERGILAGRFGESLTLTHLGIIWEVSEATIRNRIKGALRRLQHQLGGPSPRTCGSGCECCDYVGTRRAMTNAAARAITANQYEE